MEFLTAGASLLGGLVNNLFAGKRQDEAQEFAQQQAAQSQANFRLNRQTAYQDTMADMKAAGLNPILAYQRGATGGTMSPTPSPSITPTSDFGIGQAATSALAAMKTKAELQNMQETNKLIQAQTAKTMSEKNTEDNRPANVKADTEQKTNLAERLRFEIVPQLQKAAEAGHLLDFMVANPSLVHAVIAGSYLGGKAGEAAGPFIDAAKSLLSGITKNSAPSTLRGGGSGTGGSSAKQNLTGPDRDVIVNRTNKLRMEKGGPAPPHPGRGWFSDRFYGVDQ